VSEDNSAKNPGNIKPNTLALTKFYLIFAIIHSALGGALLVWLWTQAILGFARYRNGVA
jgi:hypothetical protein